MKCQIAMATTLAMAALVVGGSASSVALAAKDQVTPVQKVIQLMEGMLAKGKEEKHGEEVQFAAYKQFCDDTQVEKKRAIQEADDKISVLEADIEKYTATVNKMTKEIADHEEDVAVWQGDEKAATKVRELENSDYEAMHKDYSESISALERAISVLKEQAHDRPQAASLEQVSALTKLALVPDTVKNQIDGFLQADADALGLAAPAAHGYEFQSQGVIEMLEGLLDKFVTEKTDLEKKEMNGKHAYDMLMKDLNAQIVQGEQDIEDKSQSKAKASQAKADAKGDVAETTKTRNADKKYVDDLSATCEQKATDFASRNKLRAEELEAINKAIEIISSSSVKGNAEKHLPALDQQGSALAMLRSETHSAVQARVAEYLHRQAVHLDSGILSALAARVAADPFVKVRKMIQNLITRLMEEGKGEAEQEAWCDTELSSNEATRKEKTSAVETLHAEIDQLESAIAKLTEEITELTKGIAQLDKAMAEATELRQAEKAKNEQTIADSQEAQAAVAQALKVLKDFYEKAGDATALLQQQPEAPEIFDESYNGMQSENGGVVGMLEVIESDFARLESDTKSAEATSQSEYNTFMTDSKSDKAAKQADVEHKEAKKQDKNQALGLNQNDLEATQKELDASLKYFDELKPQCINPTDSHEDRMRDRQAEIESLQEALKILDGKSVF